ncbi:hypothetical protein ACHWQZ_G002859 [Mnemiopsis leidyi]
MVSLAVDNMLVGKDEPKGFLFENCRRNAFMAKQGVTLPKARSTGTTIVGVIFNEGVVLGADTRATGGSIVCDLNCEKIHYIADNVYCCGAGTAADTEFTTRMVSSKMELLKLRTGREGRVISALRMLKQYLFRYQGHVSAALVLGGVDVTGPALYTVYPHGSTDKLPYVTMGSGSLAAMSVFEDGYKVGMNEEEAKKLVRDAIRAGIVNDLGSGSNVDITVIKQGSVQQFRPYEVICKKSERQGDYTFPAGTTAVKSSHDMVPFSALRVTDEEVMEIS